MQSPNEYEQEVLVQFRQRLNDLDLESPLFKDMHLIRFLRARDLNVGKAEIMLRNHLDWREQNDIDTILYSHVSEADKEAYRFEISGFDKEGCPVLVCPYGRWDVRKGIVSDGRRKQVIHLVYYYFEKVYAILQRRSNGKTFQQFTGIADLEGLSFRQFSSVEIVDALLTVVKAFEGNYPETLNVCFIVNAPSIFTILWGIVKPFLTPHTARKIQIFSQSQMDKARAAIMKQIPIDQFPVKYGGKALSSFNYLNVSTPSVPRNVPDSRLDQILEEVIVGAGDKLNFSYEVERPQTVLSWTFKTDCFDIGFSLMTESNEEVVSYRRVNAHLEKQNGSVICNKAGRYIITFDNTYSRLRPKNLHFAVNLIKPQALLDDEKFAAL